MQENRMTGPRCWRQAGLMSKPFVRILVIGIQKEKYLQVYVFSKMINIQISVGDSNCLSVTRQKTSLIACNFRSSPQFPTPPVPPCLVPRNTLCSYRLVQNGIPRIQFWLLTMLWALDLPGQKRGCPVTSQSP